MSSARDSAAVKYSRSIGFTTLERGFAEVVAGGPAIVGLTEAVAGALALATALAIGGSTSVFTRAGEQAHNVARTGSEPRARSTLIARW